MSDTLDLSTRRLADARQRGDANEIAEALAVHANALLAKGNIGAARSELDEATAIYRARNRVYDEARCTHLAATLCRFEGRLAEAKQRANRALALAGSQGPIAVSAHTELGEIALAEGQVAQAAAAFQSALDVGRNAGLVAPARAAILRRRAAALVAAKQYIDAIHDLETAHGLLMEAGDRATAARTLIEQATAFQHGDMGPEAERAIRRAMAIAEPANDHAALADIHLLLATQALARRDAATAMTSALAARTQALAANAPIPYIGAAIAIADLADAIGDRAAAYEALATGWVTLADLLGRDAAKATFEPKLIELRQRWGAAAFTEIKLAYEAHRRAVRVP